MKNKSNELTLDIKIDHKTQT